MAAMALVEECSSEQLYRYIQYVIICRYFVSPLTICKYGIIKLSPCHSHRSKLPVHSCFIIMFVFLTSRVNSPLCDITWITGKLHLTIASWMSGLFNPTVTVFYEFLKLDGQRQSKKKREKNSLWTLCLMYMVYQTISKAVLLILFEQLA